MKNCFKFLVSLVVILNLVIDIECITMEVPNENREPTQQADRLQKIKENGLLTVLTVNNEPYSYISPKTGEFRGFDAEIISEVAKRLGAKKVNVQYTAFSNALEELVESPNIDLFAEGLYVTDERKKLVNFTNPIYTLNEAILIRKDSGISYKGDLKNKVIGVLGGTVYESIVDNWKKQGLLKDYTVFYDDNSFIIALENGTVDAILTDSIIAENIILLKPKSDFRLLSENQYKSEIELRVGYPLKKEDTTLLNAINEKLQEMKSDGTIYNILAKHGLANHYIP